MPNNLQPAHRYKIGDTFYELIVDEQTGEFVWHTHVLRTIRGKFAYTVLKASYTWGKRSTKTGDFGWLDPIPTWCRTRLWLDRKPPDSLSPTKLGAIKYALESHREFSEPSDYPRPEMHGEVEKRLQTMLTREQNKRNKS